MSTDAPPAPRKAGITTRPKLLSHLGQRPTPARLVALISAAVCLALLASQVYYGWHSLYSDEVLNAVTAHKYVWANAAAAMLIAVFALAAPGRWRWLAVLGPAAYFLAILLATAIPGGQALAMLAGIFTMAGAWDTGERLLRRLGADSLSRLIPVAWLAGLGPWSLGTLALGLLSLLRWWTLGILLVAVGTIGSVRLAARLMARRGSIATELGGSRLSLASAGLILLTCGWAAIYTAAPEIQYDALYGKAYLPELWARTGHIEAIVQHVQDSVTGWFQVLATNGHLLGATAVGRYMQLLSLMCAVATVWWWGRRHGALGPLAAVAIAVTPHLFWQASTADDDLLLALCALALVIAVVESLRTSTGRDPRGIAFALGLMAGSGPSLKLHLVPLFAFLLLGWILAGRASRSVLRRFGYATFGALITGLPPLVLRWIETGNPVLPAYNNIFRSKYWLPINETVNFPFWPHPGPFGPLNAVLKAVTQPSLMAEAAPPGAYGLLIGATVLALLLGWLGRDRHGAARVVWIALLPAALFWWVSLRYLRYLLPIDFVSLALVVMLTAGVTLGRWGRTLGVVAATTAVIASFPVTISQFWNVPTRKPPVYAAIGRWSASSYENAVADERPALLAYNRLAPHNARMITTAYERVWLKPERDIYNLNYEVRPLMKMNGPTPVPTTGDQALADLRRLGIEWALVTGTDALLNEPEYLSQVLTDHGEIRFAERGWDLYQLVAHPRAPQPLSDCDTAVHAVPACWGVARTTHLTVSVTRTVAVCPGETLALTVTQGAAGVPSPVLVRFTGGSAENGIQPGQTTPGLAQRIYATAPPGAKSAAVTISPIDGARITAASLGTLGPRQTTVGSRLTSTKSGCSA